MKPASARTPAQLQLRALSNHPISGVRITDSLQWKFKVDSAEAGAHTSASNDSLGMFQSEIEEDGCNMSGLAAFNKSLF